MSDAELVHRADADGVAVVTLDSPHNRNALSARVQTELNHHLHEAVDDRAVRVIVLTATGPAFCSGGDLAEQRADSPAIGPELFVDSLQTLWDSPTPVIARVNGPARAGGLGLIAACDIALAPRSASFGFAEVRIGVLPAIIAVPCLRRMPARAAAELFLTGVNFDAERAAEVGLITRAVDDDALDAETDRLVGQLRKAGPEALRGVKQMMRAAQDDSMPTAFTAMQALSAARFASNEAREGIRAFLEKRQPSWVGP